MLLKILETIAALILGLGAGVLLATVVSLVVWWAVSTTKSTSGPEFSEILFRRVWVTIPLTALFTLVLTLAGPGSLSNVVGISICILLAFQVGRAYQYYSN